jgi:hypothetical protein
MDSLINSVCAIESAERCLEITIYRKPPELEQGWFPTFSAAAMPRLRRDHLWTASAYQVPLLNLDIAQELNRTLKKSQLWS